MIVNIRVEVDDATRQRLASMAEGRPVKRQATRKEVTEFVEGALASLRAAPAVVDTRDGSEALKTVTDALSARRGGRKLSEPDPEDRETLVDKPPNYIMGWNRYKYKCSQASS